MFRVTAIKNEREVTKSQEPRDKQVHHQVGEQISADEDRNVQRLSDRQANQAIGNTEYMGICNR
jgi:hypothetical protein